MKQQNSRRFFRTTRSHGCPSWTLICAERARKSRGFFSSEGKKIIGAVKMWRWWRFNLPRVLCFYFGAKITPGLFCSVTLLKYSFIPLIAVQRIFLLGIHWESEIIPTKRLTRFFLCTKFYIDLGTESIFDLRHLWKVSPYQREFCLGSRILAGVCAVRSMSSRVPAQYVLWKIFFPSYTRRFRDLQFFASSQNGQKRH